MKLAYTRYIYPESNMVLCFPFLLTNKCVKLSYCICNGEKAVMFIYTGVDHVLVYIFFLIYERFLCLVLNFAVKHCFL